MYNSPEIKNFEKDFENCNLTKGEMLLSMHFKHLFPSYNSLTKILNNIDNDNN